MATRPRGNILHLHVPGALWSRSASEPEQGGFERCRRILVHGCTLSLRCECHLLRCELATRSCEGNRRQFLVEARGCRSMGSIERGLRDGAATCRVSSRLRSKNRLDFLHACRTKDSTSEPISCGSQVGSRQGLCKARRHGADDFGRTGKWLGWGRDQ